MRASSLCLMILLAATSTFAQEPAPSDGSAAGATPRANSQSASPTTEEAGRLPVSVDRIRQALEQQPTKSLFSTLPSDQPTFRIDVKDRNRVQDLIATLDFKAGPTPAGGLYNAEQQRVLWPATNYPLQQPYAAFSQPELLTIMVENLAGKYLVGKAIGAITSADRARAEASARDEVRRAIGEYCSAQPNGGTSIAICTTPTQ